VATPNVKRLSGVLVVDKPGGKTSHDVVAEARRYFGTRAVGHAGTLDPLATGVLVLLFGEACKLSSHLTADDKSYRATVRFGVHTDTLDADGRVLETRELAPDWLSPEALERALAAERARTLQVPPSVSAIQTDGQRAYDRVRRGESVELAPRRVELKALSVLALDACELRVELTVSKGYYVRAFARDLGLALGVPAHLSALRRLSSGGFTLDSATPWPPGASQPALLGVAEAAARCLPVTQLTAAGVLRARRGQRLDPSEATPGALDRVCVWLGPDGELVALGTSSATGEHRVTRGFENATAD
jgi:tRNA pseudouridine55 synthase